MTLGSNEPPRATLLRLASGYRVTQAIYVVARLRVPDHLASGPKDVTVLAKEVGAEPDPLRRVLRALVPFGVFTMDASGRVGLAEVGELLRTDAPASMNDFALFQGEDSYRAFGDLLHTVRTGETAFDHLFGMGCFDYYARHPDAGGTFNRAMAGTVTAAAEAVEGYELERYHVMVDVGGGVGDLLARTLRSHLKLRGILFDLPGVVEHAPETLERAGVADRCEIRAGSALEFIPPGGDLYVMSRILHDWPDDKARLLLANCRRAMGSEGTLLLVESVLPEQHATAPVLWRDLMMMVMNGGRERTEREWRTLLGAGGFSLSRVLTTDRGFDLIEARALPS
ncbi:MAG: methyltransferase [Euryarchaeota archaeon]|nr:methyltransferase [Euryarchaeota archaeon]MDE1837317.1 methyltransferase [Euryarchaeota archaeon]MDE1879812.1 methyltransferase [Euryarchaeota archaeon]MDE2045252.1 methyltransferase [Thermoplasmata archaeon]